MNRGLVLLLFLLATGSFASAQTATELCKDNSRSDCPEAIGFFQRLQDALRDDDRGAVASMARYPLRVRLNGKGTLLRSKRELLQNYKKVFDAAILCSILRAKRTEVWDNWQGFSITHGEIWWERRNAPNARFKLITVNNGAFYPGCQTGSQQR